jgi:hypothetical protein
MEAIVPTIYGSQLYNSLLLDIPFMYQPYSTINETLSINTGAINYSQAYKPSLNYIAIGNGGHKIISGNTGVGEPQPIQHLSTDACLFNILPFVIRPQNNDLSALEQANYALKTSRVIGNIAYFLYYLKVLNANSLTASNTLNTITNGNVISQPFVPSISNIYPTPPNLNNNQATQIAPVLVKNEVSLNFTLSPAEIQDFLQVTQIVPEAANIAIISEMALCSGVFDTALGDVIGVQPNIFISTFFPLAFNMNSLDYSFSLGNTQPLFQLVAG